MRRFSFGAALMLITAAAHAKDAADQPNLVLETGGHTTSIFKILFTPDGKEVVTVSNDRTIRRWDAATGQRLGVLHAPYGQDLQGVLKAGAFSPDGKTLAVGGLGYDRGGRTTSPIYLIDLAAGRVVKVLEHGDVIHALAFSHDGKLLASGGNGGKLLLWDVVAGRRLHSLKGHGNTAVADLAFSPDDKILASSSWDKTARLWSVDSGMPVCPPLEQKGSADCLAWKDNNTLATSGKHNIIYLWDAAGKPLQQFETPRSRQGSITSLAFLPGGGELFYGWVDNEKRGGAFLNLAKPEASRDGPTVNESDPRQAAISPDGKVAATLTDEGTGVSLWTAQNGKEIVRLEGRGQPRVRVGWAPKGHAVAWADAIQAGKDADLHRSFDLDALRIGARPNTKYIRGLSELDDLHLESLGKGVVEVRRKNEVVATLKGNNNPQCVAWLPGGRVVLAHGGSLSVYNANTGEPIRGLKGHTGAVADLAVSPDGRYLVGAFHNQTLRIWDPEVEEPLLSLFVVGGDWVAWTREGYYAASPAGERLMGWVVNNGLQQLGTFYPAAQFHNAFYRPDIIQRVLTEGSVEKARAAADKASGKTTVTVDVAQALPPEVEVVAPAAADPANPNLEVKAAADGKDRPVVSLRLLLDGRPWPGAEVKKFPDGKRGEKAEAAWTVKKPEGDHVLSIFAESDLSAAPSPTVAVAYRQAVQEPLPTLYVLAIGVNAYPGSLKLNWAVDDATAVANVFKTGGAPKPFGKVEVKLLLDKEASKDGILAGLNSLKAMTADDTAVVFYAGHGHRDKKTSQFFMLPQDVDVTDLDKTGVTGTEIKKRLQAAPGRVLVLLDACHSGSIGQSPADPGSLTDDVQRQLAAPDCGAVIMCAAMAQEEAGEAAAVKHGFFTAALLKGLGGAAAPSKDGLIHLTALNFYVEETVAELSKDEQHVVIDRPSTVTSFPLVRSAAKAVDK